MIDNSDKHSIIIEVVINKLDSEKMDDVLNFESYFTAMFYFSFSLRMVYEEMCIAGIELNEIVSVCDDIEESLIELCLAEKCHEC